jgi:hypothetical protein
MSVMLDGLTIRPGPSRLEVEIGVVKFINLQIVINFLQNWFKQDAIHKLINSIWSKEELPDQWKESIIVPVHKKGDKTDCNNCRGISLLSTSYKILSNILLSRLVPYIDKIIISMSFNLTDPVLIRFSAFVRCWWKNGSTMRQYISYLSKVPIGKQLSESFPIQNGLNLIHALSPLLFNFALEYAIRKV